MRLGEYGKPGTLGVSERQEATEFIVSLKPCRHRTKTDRPLGSSPFQRRLSFVGGALAPCLQPIGHLPSRLEVAAPHRQFPLILLDVDVHQAFSQPEELWRAIATKIPKRLVRRYRSPEGDAGLATSVSIPSMNSSTARLASSSVNWMGGDFMK